MKRRLSSRHILGLIANEVFLERLGRVGSSAELERLGRRMVRAIGAHRSLRVFAAATVVVPDMTFEAGSYRLGSRRHENRLEGTPGILVDGVLDLARKRFGRARTIFSRGLVLDPNSLWTFLLRGFAASQQGDADEALADFARAHELDPAFGWSLALTGRLRLELRDPRGREDLNAAANLGPECGWLHACRGDYARAIKGPWPFEGAHLMNARALLDAGKPAAARRGFLLALKKGPVFQEPYYALSKIDFAGGRVRSAIGFLKRACEFDRAYIWDRNSTSIFVSNRHHGLPESLWPLADVAPRNSGALAWRGQTHLLRKNYIAALADLGRAVDSHEDWPALWRAETLRRLGRNHAAIAAIGGLPPGFMSPWRWLVEGGCRLALGQFDRATRLLTRVIAMDPLCGRGLPYAWRAEVACLTSRPGALDDSRRAAEFNPRWAWGRGYAGEHKIQADHHIENGRWDEALMALSRALEPDMDPWNLAALRARARTKEALRDPSAIEDRTRADRIESLLSRGAFA